MEILNSALPDLYKMFGLAYRFIFDYYGWVLFIFGILYSLWRVYLLEIQHQYVHSNTFHFFSIRVPKDNLLSTLAVESIFAQLHALHVGKTFAEKYIEGHIQLWYSLEVISLGGQVSLVVRVPEKVVHNFEAAIYAHYPQAEIIEISDYMENLEYDPDDPNCPIEIFGTEWRLVHDDVIPIKTYKDFEHPAAEETIVDPLASFFEAMAKFEPHEIFAVQILIQPLATNDWAPRAKEKIKELIGDEEEHKASFWSFLGKPFKKFAEFSYNESLFGSHHHAPEPMATLKQKNNWMQLTEGEKERVTLIESKYAKPGYRTKIRFLYVAPKATFNRNKIYGVIGAYRPFSSAMSNELKPDVSNTWTGVDYVFSKTLEKPYLDWLLKYKKKWMFKGFKERDVHIGVSSFIFNSEEIATIYHFPLTTKTTTVPTSIQRTEAKKSQPPVNLPVME